MEVLRVLSGGAAKGLVAAVQSLFEQRTGVRVAGTFSAVGQMRQALLDGEPCDVLILTRSMIDALIAQEHCRAGSARDLGSVRTGVAVPDGAPPADVSTAAAVRTTLLSATALYIPDPERATAGIHCLKVLEQLGIAAAMRPKLRTYPNGAAAMAALSVAGDLRAIGCTQTTEIVITPGIQWVADLPRALELVTVYCAAVCTQSSLPEQGRALIDLLIDPGFADARSALGFHPA